MSSLKMSIKGDSSPPAFVSYQPEAGLPQGSRTSLFWCLTPQIDFPDNRFRVFYDIDMETRRVYILAIGVKERDRLFIGGKEVDL